MTDFKTRNEKRKVYNALAAASIFKNSAGVDTSRRQVVPLDAFLQFLTMFQKENLSEDEVNQLIEVCIWIVLGGKSICVVNFTNCSGECAAKFSNFFDRDTF